jgi:hypothetical protein
MDISNLYFVEEIIVILTNIENGKSSPVSRTLRNMQDLINLHKEIRDGKLLPYVGDFTLDQQLWFAVAKYAKLVREKSENTISAPPTSPSAAALDILEQ